MKRILFIAGIMLMSNLYAQTVTNLTGFYKRGQVFLTWTNVSNSTSLYKVYRSTTAITSSGQLATAEYLGQTNYHSSKDFNLSNVDGTTRYLHLDSLSAALNANIGLFAATTLVNGSYYYAVTTSTGGIENTTITSGVNSLAGSIVETISKPQPVLQETRTINGFSIEIYAMFQSSKYATSQPLLINVAGFFTHDFALNRTTNSVSNPLLITNHGGGSTFLDDVALSSDGQAKINIEDWFPDSTISSGYWGSNPAYDIYNSDNNVAPTTGVNVNYTQLLYSSVIDWAINHVVFDTNRISLSATSTGSPGAFFYAITYPTRIAAVKLSVGAYDLGFLNDYNPDCSLNTGKKNRKDGDKRLGKVETNLDCSLGIKTYDALNGGKTIHNNPDREYPFIYSINGKLDKQVGWTEKTIWYDSVNNNHFGGWFFWDNRDHNGDNGTWDNENFDVFKYYRNRSFPAISNCSLNEDFGNGDGNTGATYGTVNGAVDWVNEITESTTTWTTKLFIRDLIKKNSLIEVYADSCTADVTPRRRQQFKPVAGSTINYVVTHNGNTVQTGSVLYQGSAMIIPGLKIFKDTSVITLSTGGLLTFFLDADQDGYGNSAISIQAATQPAGYVVNSTDCNDANASINPGSPDICNSIDDNCNGVADENAVTVSINSNGVTAVCSPASISLSSVITGTVTSYQWLLNNASISGATNNTYLATSTGSYSLKISNAYCSSTSSSISITINSLPNVNITPSGTITECKGVKITFSATAVSGNTYQWLKGGVAISGETNSTYTTPKNESGHYSVKITSGNSCSATSSETILNRLNQPTATITALGNLDICATGSVTLQASSGNGYTYQWKKDGGKISGATNITYTATSAGAYKIKITNTDGCSKTSAATNVTKSCRLINEENNISEKVIAIQPVPNDGNFEVVFQNFMSGSEGAIMVRDLIGKIIFSESIEINSNVFNKHISLSNQLPDGIYFVEFMSEGYKNTQKITIVK